MATPPGLCLNWSEIPKTGFLMASLLCCISRTKQQASVDSDDEEIPSDSDEEMAGKQHTADDTSEVKVRKRKLKIEDYPEFLAKRHREFQEYRYHKIHEYSDTWFLVNTLKQKLR